MIEVRIINWGTIITGGGWQQSDFPRQSGETGFNELMLEQLGQLNLDDHKQAVANRSWQPGWWWLFAAKYHQIVDDLAFRQNIITSEKKWPRAGFTRFSSLIPGICARNLQNVCCCSWNVKWMKENMLNWPSRVLEKLWRVYKETLLKKSSGDLG